MNRTGRGRGRGRVMLAPAICRRYICVCELDFRAPVWSLRFFCFFLLEVVQTIPCGTAHVLLVSSMLSY